MKKVGILCADHYTIFINQVMQRIFYETSYVYMRSLFNYLNNKTEIHMNKVKPWTNEEKALFGKGLSDAQIVEKTGRTMSSVINKRSYLKSISNGKSDGEEFTTQEKRVILTTPDNKEAAGKIGATVASVKEMREWLGQEEEPQVRMAAKAKIPRIYSIEEIEEIDEEAFDNKLLVRFGDSTMILNKSEISSIQIGEGGILITR